MQTLIIILIMVWKNERSLTIGMENKKVQSFLRNFLVIISLKGVNFNHYFLVFLVGVYMFIILFNLPCKCVCVCLLFYLVYLAIVFIIIFRLPKNC